MDQQLAMRWVQENIKYFNGDPSRVQLFGQSAGAISIMVHLTLPSSEPLFTTAVMQSNPFHIPFKEQWEAGIQANYFGEKIGCPTLNKECLRSGFYAYHIVPFARLFKRKMIVLASCF